MNPVGKIISQIRARYLTMSRVEWYRLSELREERSNLDQSADTEQERREFDNSVVQDFWGEIVMTV